MPQKSPPEIDIDLIKTDPIRALNQSRTNAGPQRDHIEEELNYPSKIPNPNSSISVNINKQIQHNPPFKPTKTGSRKQQQHNSWSKSSTNSTTQQLHNIGSIQLNSPNSEP